MDFTDDSAPEKLREALGSPADLVMSDMAANTVGHAQTDHLRTMAPVESGAWFAIETLRPGGSFIAKVLAGGADMTWSRFEKHFTTVNTPKPPASRKESNRMVCTS